MGTLEAALRARREQGGKAFVPYVTGGFPGVDAALLQAIAEAGADAIEVGVPHSDPVMDGGVIQQASSAALAAGARPADVLATIRGAALDVPVAVMTYVNPVLRWGIEAFLDEASRAGVSGMIVPDLPVDEADALITSCAARDIDAVLLAAPGSAPERLAQIGARGRGFVYCVATYGVTGARTELSSTAEELVRALRPLTDLPLLVGVGIATPEIATEACRFADGVVVGSAIMAALTEPDRADAIALASEFAEAIRASGRSSDPSSATVPRRQRAEG
jgi:tryptophan synthase alpha chain